jgi:peptidoglycan DL-endopeptidase CwlO
MSIDVVESRVATLQSQLAALSAGQTPSVGAAPADAASTLAFSDVLDAQNGAQGGDLSSLLDQVGGGISTSASSSDIASSLAGSLSSSLGTSSGSDSLADQLSSLLGAAAGSTSATGGAAGPTGSDVVADAEQYLGVPYTWGGTNPATGLDCSGLVQRVMKDLGVSMPRTVAQQRNIGQPVDSLKDAQPGDLLVFGSHHIGIYVGNGKMLHAPHTGDHVRISDVYETPTRIRRVLPSGTSTGVTAELSALDSLRPAALRQTTSGSSGSSGSHQFDTLFATATQKYHLPSGLLRAVASVESSFNPNAISPAGAQGLMQLMPGTARGLGVDAMNPTQAVDGAGRMLSGLIHEFGSVKLAIAAYNAGAGAVKRYGGVPPYAETQSYVRKVTSRMEG